MLGPSDASKVASGGMRASRWLFPVAVVSVVTALAFVFHGGVSPNPLSRVMTVLAVVERGTLSADPWAKLTADHAIVDGHIYSDKAPLSSFVVIPFYWVWHLVRDRSYGRGRHRGVRPPWRRVRLGRPLRSLRPPPRTPRRAVDPSARSRALRVPGGVRDVALQLRGCVLRARTRRRRALRGGLRRRDADETRRPRRPPRGSGRAHRAPPLHRRRAHRGLCARSTPGAEAPATVRPRRRALPPRSRPLQREHHRFPLRPSLPPPHRRVHARDPAGAYPAFVLRGERAALLRVPRPLRLCAGSDPPPAARPHQRRVHLAARAPRGVFDFSDHLPLLLLDVGRRLGDRSPSPRPPYEHPPPRGSTPSRAPHGPGSRSSRWRPSASS